MHIGGFMREKTIEQKLCQAVTAAGGWAVKLNTTTAAGLPDRLLLMPKGTAAFVEVKAPSKKPRPLQRVQMEKLRKLGFPVFVLDDPGLIPEIIEEVNHGIQTT